MSPLQDCGYLHHCQPGSTTDHWINCFLTGLGWQLQPLIAHSTSWPWATAALLAQLMAVEGDVGNICTVGKYTLWMHKMVLQQWGLLPTGRPQCQRSRGGHLKPQLYSTAAGRWYQEAGEEGFCDGLVLVVLPAINAV